MSDNTSRALAGAILLGSIAGIRSMSAVAAVSRDAVRNKRALGGTPFAILASPTVASLVALAALGEMGADKLPFLPNRTDPGPLFGRLVLGGAAGAALFTEEDQAPAVGALLAALAAFTSAHASFRARRALSRAIPGPLAGLLGDATAIALGITFLNLK